MGKYTIKDVEDMASDLREAPATSLWGAHVMINTDKAVAIYEALNAYADLLREREAAKAGVTDNVQRVAKHMAQSVEYIEKVYPGAKQLDAGPIMRNLHRWSKLLAAAPKPVADINHG